MAYAETSDVADRLGRDLTESEERQAGYLLEGATATINHAAGIPPNPAPDPAPELLRLMTVELTVRVLGNPSGVTRYVESLGAYSYAPTFAEGGAGAFLTPVEAAALGQILYGPAYSARLPSVIDDVMDYADDAEINRSWPAAPGS